MNILIDVSNVNLETKRLQLRPWKFSDVYDLYTYASVDGVGQMARWRPHQNLSDSKFFIKHFIENKNAFAIVKKGKVIGSLSINKYNETLYSSLTKLKGCEIGFSLSKDYWGQGIMPEAIASVIDYLFNQNNLDFILASSFAWNHQSERVLEKCNFKYFDNIKFGTNYGTYENINVRILLNSKSKISSL